MTHRNRNGRRVRDEFDDASDDEDERIQYGIRRARREISWEYRDSSSLTPLQMMEQEIYYHTAESMLHQAIYLGHVLALLATMYQHCRATLLRWQNSGSADLMESAVVRVEQLRQRCKDSMDKLYFSIVWMLSYGEFSLLYAEELST